MPSVLSIMLSFFGFLFGILQMTGDHDTEITKAVSEAIKAASEAVMAATEAAAETLIREEAAGDSITGGEVEEAPILELEGGI